MPEITTVSGKRVDLLNPDMSQIDIEDIAHHLALINRYYGATKLPYSVAQHSVYVANATNSLEGLLHDAKEYVIGDVASPVKEAMIQLDCDDAYTILDRQWTQHIVNRFNLNVDAMDLVHDADVGVRQDELRLLKGIETPVYYLKRIQPWGWRKAKRKFLETYERLNGPR